jgi:hypothetical protein
VLTTVRQGHTRDQGARRWAIRRASEVEGFTLVETMVSMVASLTIMVALVLVIGVYASAEGSTTNSANAAANVRITLLALQHDIQSANPLVTLGTVTAYNDELELVILPANANITWQYNASSGQLTRQVGSAAAVVMLSNVTNGASLPVFTYYDHCGINQVTEPQSTPSSVSGATTVVGITLAVAGLDTAPYGTTSDVSIMNQPPATNRCG